MYLAMSDEAKSIIKFADDRIVFEKKIEKLAVEWYMSLKDRNQGM